MGRVYLYADETGDLGYDSDAAFFGVGTATFAGVPAQAMWDGFELRTRLEADGIRLPRGLHAKDDANRTRAEVFELLSRQQFQLDTTFMHKASAYPSVKGYPGRRLRTLERAASATGEGEPMA